MGDKLKPTIVGIDIGITTGVAILDLNGEIISLFSKRYKSKNELIKEIIKYGKPLIIASDVKPVPKAIEKIAKNLGSKLFFPEKSLTKLEKEKIIKDFKEKIKSSHEKDALAASLKAFKKYRSLFIKINEIAKKENAEDLFSEIARVIIEKKSENIADVIRRIKSGRKKS